MTSKVVYLDRMMGDSFALQFRLPNHTHHLKRYRQNGTIGANPKNRRVSKIAASRTVGSSPSDPSLCWQLRFVAAL